MSAFTEPLAQVRGALEPKFWCKDAACPSCNRARSYLAALDRVERLAADYERGSFTINGHSAALLLTEEQIDLILHEFRDVSIMETLACTIKDELRRAKTALTAARAALTGEGTG